MGALPGFTAYRCQFTAMGDNHSNQLLRESVICD